jgi:hypothetical protein
MSLPYPAARYFGTQGEVSGRLRPEDRPPDLAIGAVEVHYLATGASTGGQFGLYRTMSESFFVLSGSMRLYDGERWIDGHAGDFLSVPEGGIHAFENDGDEPASMLLLFAPGAPREPYFEALAAMANGQRQLSPAEWSELCLRHDNHFL